MNQTKHTEFAAAPTVAQWAIFRKKHLQPMRPYVPGESMEGISVSGEDTPEPGGMIAVNPANPADKWYVSKQFFADNYELAPPAPRPSAIPAHLQRVVDEKRDLDERLGKLQAFRDTPTHDALAYAEQLRLAEQAAYMKRYSEVLGDRLEAAGIGLPAAQAGDAS